MSESHTDTDPRVSFLLYESRSGSTMLASRLHSLAGLNVVPENGFVPRILFSNIDVDSPTKARSMIDVLYREQQFCELDISRDRLYSAFDDVTELISKKRFLTTCLRVIQDELGFDPTKMTLIKSACYESMGDILKVWPDAKFIHIVRDGRAVFNSLRSNSAMYRKQPMNNNVIAAGRSWSRKVLTTPPTDHCHVILYEKFLSDGEKSVSDLLDFLDIAVDERHEDPSKGSYSKRIGASQTRLHVNVGSEAKVVRGIAWQSELSRSAVAAYELVAGEALEKMGYAPFEKLSRIDRLAAYPVFIWHGLMYPVRMMRLLVETLLSSKDLRYRISRKLRRMKFSNGSSVDRNSSSIS